MRDHIDKTLPISNGLVQEALNCYNRYVVVEVSVHGANVRDALFSRSVRGRISYRLSRCHITLGRITTAN